jgi:TRAP-type uncharacterized transport system substrate-binding protein
VKKKLSILMVLVLMASLFATGCPPPDPDVVRPPDRVVIRLGTASIGTVGYRLIGTLAAILDEEFPAHYEFIVFPFASVGAAMKAGMHGGTEIAIASDAGMTEVYAGTGPFTGFTPRKGKLIHTFVTYPLETFLAVPARDAHLYRSWADLSGLPIYFGPFGGATYMNMKRSFHRALGYDFRHVEVGFAAMPDALAAGTIRAATVWTAAEVMLAPWVMELDMRTDITIINPTPAERAKMTAAGLLMIRVSPDVFVQDVGVPEIWGVRYVMSFNARPDLSQEFVYNMLTALYRRKADLYRLEPGLGPLSRDFVGFQVAGIKGNPHIPVHPGLHQFLVEKGAWDPAWTVAS